MIRMSWMTRPRLTMMWMSGTLRMEAMTEIELSSLVLSL
jgi:hypothetical protein